MYSMVKDISKYVVKGRYLVEQRKRQDKKINSTVASWGQCLWYSRHAVLDIRIILTKRAHIALTPMWDSLQQDSSRTWRPAVLPMADGAVEGISWHLKFFVWYFGRLRSRAGRYGWKIYYNKSVSYQSIWIIIDSFFKKYSTETSQLC